MICDSITLIDEAISYFENRFEQLKIYENTFGFLNDLEQLNFLDNN